MTPTLILSLDKELIWGSFDHTSPDRFSARNPDSRGVVRRLLRMLEEREIAATWAIVGHLFLGSCARSREGIAHPEIVRPRHRWYQGDWLQQDPCSDLLHAPLWYGSDIVELLLASSVPQEIACHSFSHIIFGDEGCSAEAAESDLAACVDVARQYGITLRSFVYPRNSEGHYSLLRKYGFVTFRGADSTWFEQFSGLRRRGAHYLDQMLALKPRVSLPQETLPGLWKLPGSMLFLDRRGIRRAISLRSRIRKATAGLDNAIRRNAIFHLWFHPFNLASDPEGLFMALGSILDEATKLREEGIIEIRTMGDVGAELVGKA